MIARETDCDLRVGQNGWIVLSGPPEGVVRAAKAIKMIEEEAYMADLTQKVQSFLVSGEQVG